MEKPGSPYSRSETVLKCLVVIDVVRGRVGRVAVSTRRHRRDVSGNGGRNRKDQEERPVRAGRCLLSIGEPSEPDYHATQLRQPVTRP